MIELEYIDPVACKIARQHAKSIQPAVSFQRSYWVQTPKGKRQKFYDYSFWITKNKEFFYFPSGLLPKVLSYCRENNIPAKVMGKRTDTPTFASPKLSGIIFRNDQMDAIEAALTRKRGVIKAPTRTGKSVIMFGICSCAPMNVLFLADKTDLVQQLAEEGRRFGFNTHEVHGQQKDLSWDKNRHNIVCMTRRTAKLFFKKKESEWARIFFDAVIVDECHHIATAEGEYADILKLIPAPLRFGFTATLPPGAEADAALTGFLGPLIYDLTINDAVEKDLLIKPKIKLIKPPLKKIAVNKKYDEVYQELIVEHPGRHDLIAETTRNFLNEGKSVLILVNRLDHGTYQQYAFEKLSLDIPFIHGKSDSEEREIIRKNLINKKILCAIVSTIWKEGINIPTLDVCINAAGGVSEIGVLQSVGRSLTKAEGKDQAIIIDVFDQGHHYLIRHFGERLCLYMDSGWL